MIGEPEVQELGELGWSFNPFKARRRATKKPKKAISRAFKIKVRSKKRRFLNFRKAPRNVAKKTAKQNKKISLNKVGKAKVLTKPTMTKVSCNLNKLQQIYNNNKKVLEQNRKIYQANLQIYNNNKKVLEQNRKIYQDNLQIYNNNKKVVNEFKQLLKKYGLA